MQRNHRHKTLHFIVSALVAAASFGAQSGFIQQAHATAPTRFIVQPHLLMLAPNSPTDATFPACGSMQTCIDNAVAGDTISVTAGVYSDSFTLNKAVSLVGLNAGATFVALSGQRVLTVTDPSMTQTTRIANLTFTGGNPTSSSGGGIRIANGAPLLANVVVTGNIATDGGGIYAAAELHANGLIVRNNSAIGFAGIGLGGGVFVTGRAVITGMQVINNAATGDGAGMYLQGGDNSVIQASRFEKNKTPGEGGGLFINNSNSVLLLSDRFFDNSGEVGGGGAYIANSRVNIDNNMFAFNYGKTITDGVELGLGGVSPSVVNGRHNTFANARSSLSNVRAIELGKDVTDSVYMTNTVFDKYNIAIQVLTYTSDVKLNAVLWSGIGPVGQLWSGSNVTNTNPYTALASFADPNNRDFRISPISGNADNMVDKGVDAGLTTDIEEFHRPHGYGFDLGADEINRKPVADYDSQIIVEIGQPVTIAPGPGGVIDPDGDPLVYLWQQVAGSPVTLSGINTLTTTFTAPLTPTTTSTDLKFIITITDTAVGGTTIVKNVRVKLYAQVAGLSAQNDSPKIITESVTLTPSLTAGTSVSYTWNFGDGSTIKNIAASGNPVVTHTYAATGTFIAIVTATNVLNSLTTTTTVIINSAAATPTPTPTPPPPANVKIYLPLLAR